MGPQKTLLLCTQFFRSLIRIAALSAPSTSAIKKDEDSIKHRLGLLRPQLSEERFAPTVIEKKVTLFAFSTLNPRFFFFLFFSRILI
jgi:hypothetical protein